MNIYDELHERALELVKKWNKFDFENLEYWENNSKWASFMRASESSESDSLCLVYNIVEARMCAYMGRIAVIKDKDDPHLVFTSKVYSVWFCAILSPLFIYLLSEYLPLKLALFVLIAILPFKKDYLMLMLYISGKFDVKQGNIMSSERVFRRKRGELGGRYSKFYLIYNLLFEDDMGRDIPVLVNHFNYRSFKNLEHPTEAMLIRYKSLRISRSRTTTSSPSSMWRENTISTMH